MGKEIKLPDIPEEEQTPLVKVLLGSIEELAERVQRQDEEIGLLKDEIAVLKGEKKRPTFKASKLDKEAGRSADEQEKGTEGKRPGSQKKAKTAQLQIHEERVIAPSDQVPEGSRFKGYRDWVVQDLEIRAHNIRYRLERWETPDGQAVVARLPAALQGRHFGPALVSYMLYQHHHCQMMPTVRISHRCAAKSGRCTLT